MSHPTTKSAAHRGTSELFLVGSAWGVHPFDAVPSCFTLYIPQAG